MVRSAGCWIISCLNLLHSNTGHGTYSVGGKGSHDGVMRSHDAYLDRRVCGTSGWDGNRYSRDSRYGNREFPAKKEKIKLVTAGRNGLSMSSIMHA